jgi:ligand-binding sensor domain-containing protein
MFSQNLCFKNYSTHNGLPSSQVYNIFQDKNGDMWFATDRGISKYNGYQFENYDIQDGITNNTVFKFFPQKDGKIWCSTIDNSWFYFDNGKSNFTKIPYSDTIKKYSLNLLPEDIYINKDNEIHVAFNNSSNILIMDKKGKIIEPTKSVYPFWDSLYAIHVQMELDHWFIYFSTHSTTKPRFSKYKSIKQAIPFEKVGYRKAFFINNTALFGSRHTLILDNQHGTKEINFEKTIIGLGKYDDTHFWVGFLNGGVKIINLKGIEQFHFLQENSVTFLYRDLNQGIWISSLDNGIFYAYSNQLKRYLENDLSFVYNLYPGLDGDIIASSIYGEIFHGNSKTIALYDSLKQATTIKAYFEKTTHSINPGFAKFDNKTKKIWLTDVSENDKNPMIMGYSTGILHHKGDDLKKIELNEIIKCVEWSKNGFYYGTYSGVFHYDTLTNKNAKLTFPELDIRVYDIKLANKFHFFATSGKGLVRYNETTQEIMQLTTKDGLASNLINEVYPENDSIVWLATNQGLNKVCFCNNKIEIETISVEDGLPDNDITDIYVYQNDVWIGTRKGLCYLEKNAKKQEKSAIDLHLYWEQFMIDSVSQNWDSELELSSFSKNFSFQFHTAYFGNQKNLKFRYKLQGFDTKWTYTTQHKINYNSLAPGEYNLIVEASVENSLWENNSISLAFSIYPPFYKTWWFILIVIILVLYIIYLFFKYRVLIYNQDLVRELMRVLVKKLKPKSNSFLIWTQGKEIRIVSDDVLFVNSEGNYLEIHTQDKKYVIRCKIGEFTDMVPDKLEYLRVHRSYIVRLDKITGKSLEEIFIGNKNIPIGKTYKDDIKKIEI